MLPRLGGRPRCVGDGRKTCSVRNWRLGVTSIGCPVEEWFRELVVFSQEEVVVYWQFSEYFKSVCYTRYWWTSWLGQYQVLRGVQKVWTWFWLGFAENSHYSRHFSSAISFHLQRDPRWQRRKWKPSQVRNMLMSTEPVRDGPTLAFLILKPTFFCLLHAVAV